MPYIKSELVAAVKAVVEANFNSFKNDVDVEYVDVRLQLFNGSYQIWTGDSSFDTDHRGHWGYGSIIFDRDFIHDGEELIDVVVEDVDAEEIANEIVAEAIDSLLTNNEDYRDVYNIKPLDTARVSELDEEFEFTDNSEDIASTLEMIGISDLDNEVGSLYWEYCDGDIGEVWFLETNVPYLSAIAKRIR